MRHISLVIIVMLFGALFCLDKSSSPPAYTTSESLPTNVAWPYGFSLKLAASPYAYDYNLDLIFSGVLLLRQPDVITYLNDPLWHSSDCAALPDKKTHCSLPLHFSGEETSLNLIGIDGMSKQQLTSVKILTIKKSQITTLTPQIFLYGLVGCSILLITIWLLQSRVKFCQWLMVSGSVAFLLANSVAFTLCLLAYLGCCYGMRERLGRKDFNRIRTLGIAVASAIIFLMVFKYSQQINLALFSHADDTKWLLPLGISYFIIRLIDTQMRWYRGEQTQITLREFLCFMLFPGTLIAGPIETIDQFYAKRLPHIGRLEVTRMLSRTCIGLFKKIVLADCLIAGVITSSGFQQMTLSPDRTPATALLYYMFCVMAYVYLDFSAYSDIAIGLSTGLGYRIRENFNYPFLAVNIRDYWKRWHISLSDWCMRNIYFPLMLKTRNIFMPLYATMLVVGMWHTFSLSWFCWALHHATGLSLLAYIQSRIKNSPPPSKIQMPFRVAITMLFVMAGFCFAWFSSFDIALAMYLNFIKVALPLAGLLFIAEIYVTRRFS